MSASQRSKFSTTTEYKFAPAQTQLPRSVFIEMEGLRKGPREDFEPHGNPSFELLAAVDTFLKSTDKQVLLLHGAAGSGKSRFAQCMEEHILGPFSDEQAKAGRTVVIIWSNLAMLKNPLTNLFDESLRSAPLRFNELQARELRQQLADPEKTAAPYFRDGWIRRAQA